MKYIEKEIKLKKYVPLISTALYILFKVWKFIASIENINYPKDTNNFIFAIWHHDQLCLDGIPNRNKLNILISKSIDGEIIANVVERMGFKTVRGSQNKWWRDKGGTEATFELITKLKEGENIAITVDGPAGPLHEIKNGIITIAKLTGKPIIPVIWKINKKHTGHLPTWDNLKYPIWFTKTRNIYGKPIYVPGNSTPEEENKIKETLKQALQCLEDGKF